MLCFKTIRFNSDNKKLLTLCQHKFLRAQTIFRSANSQLQQIHKRQPSLIWFDGISNCLKLKYHVCHGQKTSEKRAEVIDRPLNTLFQKNEALYYRYLVLSSLPLYRKYLAVTLGKSPENVEGFSKIHGNFCTEHSDVVLNKILVNFQQAGLTWTSRDTNSKYSDNFLCTLKEFLPSLSENHFVSILKSFGDLCNEFSSINISLKLNVMIDNIFMELLNECVRREDCLNTETLLVAFDLFGFNYRKKNSVNLFEENFWRRIEKLTSEFTPQEAAAILHCVRVYGTKPSVNLTHRLLKPFIDGIPEGFSLKECGLVYFGFNKANMPVNCHKFIADTILQLKKNVLFEDSVVFGTIMKSFSRTFDEGVEREFPEVYDMMKDLADDLVKQFPRLSVQSVIRSVSFYNNIHWLSKEMQKSFFAIIKDADLRQLRPKDIAYSTYLMGLQMISLDGLQEVLNSLCNKLLSVNWTYTDERNPFVHLSYCLIGMCMLNFQTESLIRRCFSSYIIKDLDTIGDDIKMILRDASEWVRLETANHDHFEEIIPNQAFASIIKHYNFRKKFITPVSRKDEWDSFLSEFLEKLACVVGGWEYLKTAYHPTNLYVAGIHMLYQNNIAVKVPLWQKYQQNAVKRVVICVHSRYAFYKIKQDDGSEIHILGGQYQLKMRLLEKKGHTVINISELEYMAAKNKEEFLKGLLS